MPCQSQNHWLLLSPLSIQELPDFPCGLNAVHDRHREVSKYNLVLKIEPVCELHLLQHLLPCDAEIDLVGRVQTSLGQHRLHAGDAELLVVDYKNTVRPEPVEKLQLLNVAGESLPTSSADHEWLLDPDAPLALAILVAVCPHRLKRVEECRALAVFRDKTDEAMEFLDNLLADHKSETYAFGINLALLVLEALEKLEYL